MNKLATRDERVKWLTVHPELWDLSRQEMASHMKVAGVLSHSTSYLDFNFHTLLRDARAMALSCSSDALAESAEASSGIVSHRPKLWMLPDGRMVTGWNGDQPSGTAFASTDETR